MYSYNAPAMEKYSFLLSQEKDFKQFIAEYGWVVIKAIATPQEAETIISQQWHFLERLGTGLKRDQPSTWYQPGRWPGNISSGQVLAPYVGHSTTTASPQVTRSLRSCLDGTPTPKCQKSL